MSTTIKEDTTMHSLIKNNDYFSNGVTISPTIPATGDNVKISYDGLLAKSGANHIYAHIGYGHRWEDTVDVKMTKKSIGFEASVPVKDSTTLNICFKDCANNWDNNSGMNYSFDVTQ